MAGDWIKMEVCTPEKAEVLAITARLGWDDADLTVGKLFRLWRWFDQHTADGNAVGVTSALLDRIVGVSGFCEALTQVGWLAIDVGGISLPNFDRHNGNTAKNRAQTAKRVAKHKSNAKANAQGNADNVTSALPREEKRREDTSSLRSEVEAPRKRSIVRAMQLPADFYPNETGVEYAEKRGVSLAVELERFRNNHQAKGTLLKDWQAGWRTWCDKAVEFGRAGQKTVKTMQPQETAFQRAQRETIEGLAPGAARRPVFDPMTIEGESYVAAIESH